MIAGRWGKPSEVLLDLVVDEDGSVQGVASPGRQDAPISRGHFDARSEAVTLEGTYVAPDGTPTQFHVTGRLDRRTRRLAYAFGDVRGAIDIVRVEEYAPPRLGVLDRLRPYVAAVQRSWAALARPSRESNMRALHARGESLDALVFRDTVAADIPALAELHVATWNATYRTTHGPTIATRAGQWTEVFAKAPRRDFVVVVEDRNPRLVGFTWGRPHAGAFDGELSKIYLRWEYHRLGLGRRLMAETARRFLDRGMRSFVLFADLGNPTLAFYDRMGGERLLDEYGRFVGAYAWRDVQSLIPAAANPLGARARGSAP